MPGREYNNNSAERHIALPGIVVELITLLGDEQFDAMALDRRLQQHSALRAHMLRIVNSPVYTDNIQIENIEQAVNYLGLAQVSELILLLGFMPEVKRQVRDSSGAAQQWQQHVYRGLLAYQLARHSRRVHPHTVYTAALLRGVNAILAAEQDQKEIDSVIAFTRELVANVNLPPLLAECIIADEDPGNQPEFHSAVPHMLIASRLAGIKNERVTGDEQELTDISEDQWKASRIDRSSLDDCVQQARAWREQTLELLTGD